MGSLKIEYRNPSELKPYARNPRVRTDAQIDQIAASIENFGFVNPILIDETGGIIAGHGRHAAAKKLKLNKVPIIVLAGLTPEQRCALTVADNKIALNAQWDDKLLLAELSSIGIGLLPTTGFSLGDVNRLSLRSAEQKDQTVRLRERYEVLVTLSSEKEQEKLLRSLSKDGYRCRALMS